MIANLLRVSVLTTMLAAAVAAAAMPARPGLHLMQQPDGSQISVYIHGDENFAVYLNEDGRLLLPDNNGNMCFAMFDERNNVIASPLKAQSADALDAEARSFLAGTDNDALIAAYTAMHRQNSTPRRMAASPRKVRDQITNYPATGEQKVLVVLAEFSDKKFHSSDPHTAISDMLNKQGYSDFGAEGSVRDYFIDNSAGKYRPQMMVYGPVVLPNEMAYYGGRTSDANDARPKEMIRDACQLIDDEVDFSEYDLDGDGYIDNVYVFYPGYSQADGADPNTIWPHAAYAYDKLRAEFDGVKLDHYACSNEIELSTGNLVGIGTFCHEFSHVLGLPDLYAVDYSHSAHPGNWSLMANGGYNNNGHTPPNMTAYERYALGWLDPEELTSDGEQHELPDISANRAFRISTADADEYFLVENRQQTGWDAYLQGHGMLVWHIDYDKAAWAGNTVNNDAGHQRIDLVEADRIATSDTRGGDSFPGTSDLTEISGYTNPGFKSFSGAACEIGLCNIREADDGNVLFHAINPTVKLATPVITGPSDITPVSFTINWNKVADATSYVVDVYRKDRVGSTITKRYLSGYRLHITGQNYLTVGNLQPATEYTYVVRAMGGTSASDYCDEHAVTTLDKDFTFFSPETAAPTDITSTSFTAAWHPLNEATDYSVNVYEVSYSSPSSERSDMTDGVVAPEGWVTSSVSTSPFPGYYGAAAPGMAMTANDDFVKSPIHRDAEVTKVAFWYRGTSVQDGNEILISGLTASNEWQQISKISPVLREKTGYNVVVEAKDIDFPCHAASIAYYRPFNAGNIAIDDIEVEYSTATLSPLTDFTGVTTGNALSLEITGLKPNTHYRYEVVALSGGRRSQPSVPRNVLTAEYSGITTVTAPADCAISFTAENGGISVRNGSAHRSLVEIYSIYGALLYRADLLPGGSTHWDVPSTGIYVLKAGSRAYKIVL